MKYTNQFYSRLIVFSFLKMICKFSAIALATLTWTVTVQTQASGTVTGPGTISSLSANTLDRSGYLEILGSNFGGSGEVLIDGISAPVTSWESTRIVAYVPETARLATVPVQVVNDSGQPSNTLNLTVTTRVANGRVKWRFQADSAYILAATRSRCGWHGRHPRLRRKCLCAQT